MRVLRLTLGAALVLAALGLSLSAAPAGDGRQLINLDAGWRFLGGEEPHAQEVAFDDLAWEKVDLPHTWNAQDGQSGGGYRRGAGWYRRHLEVSPSLSGRRLYLQFDGACLAADVFVNGVHLGNHQGGFARFRFDATGILRPGADNVIAVRVDNADLGIPPASSDFTLFGGLYRDVFLLATDPVQVATMDRASSGVFVEQQQVNAEVAKLLVRAEVENHGSLPRVVDVRMVVLDHAHKPVGAAETTLRLHLDANGVEDVTKALSVTRPHLWDGRRDPYLYTIRLEVRPVAANGDLGEVSDAVEEPLGLRSFSVDPDRGFILNGHYLDLRGFNRHQDWPDKGWAISESDEAVDFDLMLEAGSTAVRVSHYQQSNSWYDRCDRAGLVAWAEIPDWQKILGTPEFLDSAKRQLAEMILQEYNHPSICFWGLGNETGGPAALPTLQALKPVARLLDPTRPTTYASNHDSGDPKDWVTDVVAFNRYDGWYRGELAAFGPWLDRAHREHPKNAIGMSEFGAGGSIFQHEDNPAGPRPNGPFHPEEYQNTYHEAYLAALNARPFVWCKFIWCLHDFPSDGRNEGDHAGRNDKGLVTFDRKVKKDAFYLYKANWSDLPVLHLVSSRFVDRLEAVTGVKVYSNATEVTLEVNGRVIGTQKDPSGSRIFTWPGVVLAPGANAVVARAHFGANEVTDSCTWTLKTR